MNTKVNQDQIAMTTTGKRLRQARKQLGLTPQAVAERLCLKTSIIHDIEEDKAPANLTSTFLRGYIRSYARLVHLSTDELLPTLAKQASIETEEIVPMLSFSSNKKRKRHDGWLMNFTWLVVFILLGLTGAWWWQNYKAQQKEIAGMTDQSAQLSQSDRETTSLSGDGSTITNKAASAVANTAGKAASAVANTASDVKSAATDTASKAASAVDNAASNAASAVTNTASKAASAVDNAASDAVSAVTDTTSKAASAVDNAASDAVSAVTNTASNATSAVSGQAPLQMSFSAQSWVGLKDAKGKELLEDKDHMKKNGDTMSLDLAKLAGTAPYTLTIGVPTAVKIQYQGKPIDLSDFTNKSSGVAHYKFAAE